MPRRSAHSSPAAEELGKRLVNEQERQVERLRKPDEPELGGDRQRFSDVPAVKRSAEAVISRTLRGHERMFA